MARTYVWPPQQTPNGITWWSTYSRLHNPDICRYKQSRIIVTSTATSRNSLVGAPMEQNPPDRKTVIRKLQLHSDTKSLNGVMYGSEIAFPFIMYRFINNIFILILLKYRGGSNLSKSDVRANLNWVTIHSCNGLATPSTMLTHYPSDH